MVECEVCDRSHVPNHPHIANIEGDVPIDDADPHSDLQKPAPVTSRELPDWLKDKPGEAVTPAALKYVNRLSDFLFVAGRHANDKGASDVLWQPGKNR